MLAVFASSSQAETKLVDVKATLETRAVSEKLRHLAPDHLLFGHQNNMLYGIG